MDRPGGPEHKARRRAITAVGAAILVTGLAFELTRLIGRSEAPDRLTAPPGSITRFDLDGRPIRRVAVGGGAAWFIVEEGDSGRLVMVRIDARTGRVSTLRGLHAPQHVAAGRGAIWVVSACFTVSEKGRCGGGLVVYQLDPATGEKRKTIPIGPGQPTALGVGGGGVWVVVERDPTTYLVRVDPRGRVAAEVRLPQCCGLDVAVDDRAVWVPSESGAVFRIDPTTNRLVATVKVTAGSLAAGANRLWVNTGRFSAAAPVLEVDASSDRIVQSVQGPGYGYPVAAGGRVWIAVHRADGAIVISALAPGADRFSPFRVTPKEGPLRFGKISFGPVAILGIGEGAIWTGTDDSGQIIRIQLRPEDLVGE